MKKVLLVLLVMATGVVWSLFFVWYKATRLPSWYQAQDGRAIAASAQPNADPQQVYATVEERFVTRIQQAEPGGIVQVPVSEAELNTLVSTEITEQVLGQPLISAVKAFNTDTQEGRIASGMVINLSEIPPEQLRPDERETLDRFLATFPALKNREVYLGFEGKPIIENGQIRLDRDTRVYVGELGMSVQELYQRLGASEADLQQSLNIPADFQGFSLRDVQVTPEGVVLTGIAN